MELLVQGMAVVVRLIFYVFLEFVYQLLVQGPGFVIGRWCKRDIRLNSSLAMFIGIIFWLVVATAGYFLIKHVEGR